MNEARPGKLAEPGGPPNNRQPFLCVRADTYTHLPSRYFDSRDANLRDSLRVPRDARVLPPVSLPPRFAGAVLVSTRARVQYSNV